MRTPQKKIVFLCAKTYFNLSQTQESRHKLLSFAFQAFVTFRTRTTLTSIINVQTLRITPYITRTPRYTHTQLRLRSRQMR